MSKPKFASAIDAISRKSGKNFTAAALKMEQYFGPAFKDNGMDYAAVLDDERAK